MPAHDRAASVASWPASPRHAVGVARVEPERRVEQLRHRRQDALAGEVETVHEPAFGHEKAHELLGGWRRAAVLEDHSLEDALDWKSLAVGAERPFDRRGVLVVVVGTLALSAFGSRACRSAMTTVCARNLVVAVAVTSSPHRASVQPCGNRGVGVDGTDQPGLISGSSMTSCHRGSRSRVVGARNWKNIQVSRSPTCADRCPRCRRGPALGGRRLHLVAPERPERLPLRSECPRAYTGSRRLFQTWTSSHGHGSPYRALAGLHVSAPPVERVRIEQDSQSGRWPVNVRRCFRRHPDIIS